jgi:tRNA(Glu) U13 pseudouridine synthase TruD
MKSKKSLSLSLQEKEEIRKKNKKHIFVTGEREEIKKKKWLVLIHISMHERKEKVENCLNLLCKCLYIHRRSLSFLGFFFC